MSQVARAMSGKDGRSPVRLVLLDVFGELVFLRSQ